MKKIFVPHKTILTAGSSISKKEISYVLDAVKNGWNEHAFDYLHRFEHAFASYIGVRHALATSGGTGALWLGLATLGMDLGMKLLFRRLRILPVLMLLCFWG